MSVREFLKGVKRNFNIYVCSKDWNTGTEYVLASAVMKGNVLTCTNIFYGYMDDEVEACYYPTNDPRKIYLYVTHRPGSIYKI